MPLVRPKPVLQHRLGPLEFCIKHRYTYRRLLNCQRCVIQMGLEDERKSQAFAVRMRPTVKKAGERAAAHDGVSLASLMDRLLIQYLKEKEFLTQSGDLPKDEE